MRVCVNTRVISWTKYCSLHLDKNLTQVKNYCSNVKCLRMHRKALLLSISIYSKGKVE